MDPFETVREYGRTMPDLYFSLPAGVPVKDGYRQKTAQDGKEFHPYYFFEEIADAINNWHIKAVDAL